MADAISTLTQVAVYVRRLYKQNQTPVLLYHNIEHTKTVVKRTYEIAANYILDGTEMFILFAAAWFHDTGHLFVKPLHHERRSVSIMKDFLKTKIDKQIMDAIAGCIMATKMPHHPKTLKEEIICDADTFNLGTREFIYTDMQLKKEFELRNNIPVNGWEESTLNMLVQHTYFTPYCRRLLNKGKQKNIEIVSKRIA
jgi:predicted metal-dependent HD superfamily phosphohydrolase